MRELPSGAGWQFEPKWDGFRCIAIRRRDKVVLQSKSGESLQRYFPEIVRALEALEPTRFVLDGEIMVPSGNGYSFDALLQRIHPAASRVVRLSREMPAHLHVFDLLENTRGVSLLTRPLRERRSALERFASEYLRTSCAISLSPATPRRALATRWEDRLRGRGIDGIMAKRLDAPYRSGERDAMQKVKWLRSADCVIGGFRYGQGTHVVGSLLLGLYDDNGLLHHVGYCSNIPRADREALTAKLESLVAPPGFTGRAPGGPSRWSRGRDTTWKPLRARLVVEVTFDAFSEGRFRHGTRLIRFRSDKKPAQCTFEQVAPKRRATAMNARTRAMRVAAKRSAPGTRRRKA